MEGQGKSASSIANLSSHSEIMASLLSWGEKEFTSGSKDRFSTGTIHEISISRRVVYEELERILACPDFKRSPTLSAFLRYVVERTLSGYSHKIKGYTIATEVFARDHDFDSNIDPLVRIQAGRLRKRIELYYV